MRQFPKKCKYKINPNYFDTIDTEAKAYWLGMIFADGSVQYDPDKRRYALVLQSKDKWIVENLRDALDSAHPIKEIQGSGFNTETIHYRLNLTSQLLVKKLIEYKPNSNNIIIPVMPASLVHHFIRGFFDGDGSVYTYRKKGITKHYYNVYKLADGTKVKKPYDIPKEYPYDYEAIECSIIACEYMQQDLLKNLKLANIKTRIKKSKTAWMNYVVISNKPAVKAFYNYLYRDATVYLPRKHNVFTTHYAP